jgi:NitT/TauT family transport system permease protein
MVYVPVAVILVGLGVKTQLLVIVFVVSLYPVIEVYYGIKYGRHARRKLATVYRMNLWDELSNITFPAAIPHIIAGVRLAFNLSLLCTVATEMIMGGSRGLGRVILDSVITYNLTEMYASIILLGILGYTINKLFLILESKYIHWKGHV